MRGNSTNRSSAIGSPWTISSAVRLQRVDRGGAGAPSPPLRASASSVAPSTRIAGSTASAASGDWFLKKGVTSRNEASATSSDPSRSVRVSRNLMPTRMKRNATEGSRPIR